MLTEAETEAKIRGEEAALKATSVDAHPEASAWNEPTRPLAEDKLQSGKAYHFIERDSPSQVAFFIERICAIGASNKLHRLSYTLPDSLARFQK